MFEIRMPKFGLSMEEGTVTKWFKKVGDFVRKGEPLVEVESEKIINSLESPYEGILVQIKVQEGESAKVGEVIALIGEEVGKEEGATKEEPKKEETLILASPAAKRLAKEYGIDLSKIKGTGPNGRITESDVLAYIQTQGKNEGPKSRKIPLDPLRKRIIDNLVKSYRDSVLVTNVTKVDVTEIVNLKKELPEITLTAFFVKIVSSVLKEFPRFNAHFDGSVIEEFDDVNVGVAFDTGDGLIVPVIKDTYNKSLLEIKDALNQIKERVKSKSLSVDDLSNSTFTITNLGMLRTDFFTPVLNGNEVAILGIGRIEEMPLVFEGEIKIRSVAYFSLSYDHRVIDGALAARFLGRLAEVIEKGSLLKEVLKI